MTKELIEKLTNDGYKIIVRTKENEFGVAKVDVPEDGTDFDIYQLDENETLEPLVQGELYKLDNLPKTKSRKRKKSK